MQKIPINEITFDPASQFDSVGRMFWWNGRVFRAIRHEYAEFYRELFKDKDIQGLFGKGLVQTEITSLSLEGYDLVLQHQLIPFTSYCMEWCSEMLRDAALLICDLSLDLYKRGLTFKDAHPWNILFDAGRPLFVDWGSIGSLKQLKEWPYVEFRDRFIFPLYLMSAGGARVARLFMFDAVNRPRRGDVFRLLWGRIPFTMWLHYLLNDRRHMRMRFQPDTHFFQSLRRAIETIPEAVERTEWTEYEGPDRRFSFQPVEEWPAKIRNVYELFQKMHPQTVLDIGGNRGWFSEMAARQGSQVITIDIDEPSITALYRRVRTMDLSILPLVMDICFPTTQHGLAYAYPAAQERLRADMVLALALTHHLVFKRGLTFEAIVRRLAVFTKKWLVVEFIPPEDHYVSEWMDEQHAWYTLDNFVDALHLFFSRIEVLDSSPTPRLLLICEI